MRCRLLGELGRRTLGTESYDSISRRKKHFLTRQYCQCQYRVAPRVHAMGIGVFGSILYAIQLSIIYLR